MADTRRTGKKSVHWSKDAEILRRMDSVAAMHFRGAKSYQIADVLEISQVTAHRDLSRLRQMWAEEAKAGIAEKREEAIARLRVLQMEAWSQFDKRKSIADLRFIRECEKDISDLCGLTTQQVDVTMSGKQIAIETVRVYVQSEEEANGDE